jgi:hypothetical protein
MTTTTTTPLPTASLALSPRARVRLRAVHWHALHGQLEILGRKKFSDESLLRPSVSIKAQGRRAEKEWARNPCYF